MPVGARAGARLGQYEVVSLLGAGGMGEVYQAHDTRLGRDVAVKVLPEQASLDPARLKRFEKEARASSALSHPNIVTIHEVDCVDSTTFIVMELVEGKTLRELLAEGALPVRKLIPIAAQIADGLARAHASGIVHRDLKPENVMVTRDGLVKILDFGLAKLAHPEREAGQPLDSATVSQATHPGIAVGTVFYMSPEQACGHPVDFRSDQFSFGSILYEMVTGQRPFQAKTGPETMAAIIREDPTPIASLAPESPAPLRWIVERCLSKESKERYASTEDLAKDLRSLRIHLSEGVSAVDGSARSRRGRRRVLSIALAGVAALAIALGLISGMRFLQAGPSKRPLSLALSLPADAPPDFMNTNPLALSPDGTTLVYAGVRDGRRRLFARFMDHDDVREIPETDDARHPFFSPDGLWVGFFGEKKLKKVALAGGTPITLCDAPNDRGASWGPDGTIVFVPAPRSGLQRIPAAGGDPKGVTPPDSADAESHAFPQLPQILPDGESVLFEIRSFDRPSRAAAVSLRTGERRILLENAVCPKYLPTGHLLFARAGLLYVVPFNLKRLRTAGPPLPLLQDVFTMRLGSEDAVCAFSQEGTLVYAPYELSHNTLVWVDRKGAVEQTPFPTAEYRSIALSPDGDRLAAIIGEKAEAESLLIGDLARGTLTRSTAQGLFQILAWTPEGKQIAFGYCPEGKRLYQIFWQSADGSMAPERLGPETADQTEYPSSFAPDGSALLIQAVNLFSGGPTGLHWETLVVPLTGERRARPLFQSKWDVTRAHFSPDGRWVAYESNESDGASASPRSKRWEAYVQSYPGPGPRWQISVDGGRDLRWSRSGRELFYFQGKKLMAVDVETHPTFRAGRPRTLFEWNIGAERSNGYDVSPDGTRFLMIKPDPARSGPARLKVVLNWFKEVNGRVRGVR